MFVLAIKRSGWCSSWPFMKVIHQNSRNSKFPNVAFSIVASGVLWTKHFPSLWDCTCFYISKQLRANVAFACECWFLDLCKRSGLCLSWPFLKELHQNSIIFKLPSIASSIMVYGAWWVKHFPNAWDCTCCYISKQVRANVAFACECGIWFIGDGRVIN